MNLQSILTYGIVTLLVAYIFWLLIQLIVFPIVKQWGHIKEQIHTAKPKTKIINAKVIEEEPDRVEEKKT